jgi:D-3-phosphoglycerate dehydrogenase / 2-oxoglutarate reductase
VEIAAVRCVEYTGTIDHGPGAFLFEVEPLAADSPLRRMENVFLSPHIAGGSEQARANLLEQTAGNVRRVLAGEKPVNVVNGL